MTSNTKRQYTIRRIPSNVDEALRRRARESRKSFNQVALEALADGAGSPAGVYDDLDFMIGTLSNAEAEKLDAEIEQQRRVDPELWK
jgi:hypothetical protein